MSEVIRQIPPVGFDYVFVAPRLEDEAKNWLKDEKDAIIKPKDQEESDETDETDAT